MLLEGYMFAQAIDKFSGKTIKRLPDNVQTKVINHIPDYADTLTVKRLPDYVRMKVINDISDNYVDLFCNGFLVKRETD